VPGVGRARGGMALDDQRWEEKSGRSGHRPGLSDDLPPLTGLTGGKLVPPRVGMGGGLFVIKNSHGKAGPDCKRFSFYRETRVPLKG